MSIREDDVFIGIEVADDIAGDVEIARKLEEACPVEIYAACDSGVRIVRENVDECVLCGLCIDASPPDTVTVHKLYDGTTLQR